MGASAQRQPSVQLQTLDGCGLVISRYPAFLYNAAGGGATGLVYPLPDGRQALSFPPEQVRIPPLNSRTGRLLGLPLPPGLQIQIQPEHLEGVFDPSSGQLQLQFRARFQLQLLLGSQELYRAPDLIVDTCLSTEALNSRRHSRCGSPLSPAARGQLVGVATVPRCGEAWLDRFLGLPDEALAVLECQLNLLP